MFPTSTDHPTRRSINWDFAGSSSRHQLKLHQFSIQSSRFIAPFSFLFSQSFGFYSFQYISLVIARFSGVSVFPIFPPLRFLDCSVSILSIIFLFWSPDLLAFPFSWSSGLSVFSIVRFLFFPTLFPLIAQSSVNFKFSVVRFLFFPALFFFDRLIFPSFSNFRPPGKKGSKS